MNRIVLAALAALCLAGCGDPSSRLPDRPKKPLFIKFFGFRHDVRTIVVKVPAMRSQACAQVISDALGKAEGVQTALPDYEKRTMAVTYDALKLGIKNIEFTIAAAGFSANDTPANPEAEKNLPAECKAAEPAIEKVPK